MTAQVLFNRMDVTDRFPMLGLTIRTDGSPVRAEVAVGTHWELFRSDRKAQRTPTNFYSSRAASPLLVPRGEAIYVVPPEVLARFVGQDRLYVALATTPERTGATPEVAVLPTEGSPYVSLKGLTGRSMKRVRLLPSRQQRTVGYGANGNNALEWAGDAAAPGMEQATKPNGTAAGGLPAPKQGNGNGGPASPPAKVVEYDDGFGPLPAKPESTPAPALSQALSGSGKFIWPADLPEPDSGLVTMFIEAYNARIDDGALGAPAPDPNQFRPGEDADWRARNATLNHCIPHFVSELQTAFGRGEVSRAMLLLTTAVSVEVFNLIKDRLPRNIYAHIETAWDPSDLEPVSPDVAMPRALPYLSQRIGMFLAWVDVAIRRATTDEAERIGLQKEEWEMMKGGAGGVFSVLGFVPGPAGIAFSGLGLVVQAVLEAHGPKYDEEYRSFAAAMREVRQTYKALAGAILRELIVQEFLRKTGQTIRLEMLLHPDLEAYINAHAAAVLLGWENELAFLGEAAAHAATLGRDSARASYYPHASGRPFGASVTAQARNTRQRVPLARAQEIVTPFYDPADPSTALTCQNDAFSLAREEWFVGVPNTSIYPHSAICQLRMTAPDGNTYLGTGFYIGPNRVLTCAHNLAGMSSVTIIPGRNGAGDKPFGEHSVLSSSWRIAPGYSGIGDWNKDLAVIDNVPLAAPNGQWFRFLNATPSDRLPIVVCGYSKQSNAVPALTQAIDADKQHLHGGYVTEQSNPEVIEYPILTLKGNSGSPVYHIDVSGSEPQALVCAVHVTGEPAAQGLNRGCFITPAKIDWIEGRTTAFSLSSRAFEIPLDPGVGGMSIGVDALQPADIIVSTARHAVSYAIRAGTLSAISHAMLYVGNGKVIEAVGGGVREVAIEQAIGDAILAVAYRDSRVNASIAQAIVDHARSRVGNPYNYAGVAFTGYRILNPLPARIIDGIASRLGLEVGQAGTTYCSELVLESFEHAGVPLVASRPGASAPDDLGQLSRSVLAYVGHLKAEDVPLGIPLGLGHTKTAGRGITRAMSGQSFGVHWDTTPYYPQSGGASCWAASAAMVVGWRDNRLVTDGEIADKVPVFNAYKTGLFPTDRRALADAWNLVPEPPASYTIDAWRDMLRYYGPLYMDMTWDTSGNGGHVRVLVGMDSDGAPDGSDTTMYMHDPWPGTPGKIKLSFADFLALYEGRTGNEGGQLQYQILHADGVPAGRQPVIAAPFALMLATEAEPAASTTTSQNQPPRFSLAPAPVPIAYGMGARAIPFAGPLAGVIAGAVVERVANDAGDISWTLDQLRGFKHPNDVAPSPMPAVQRGPVIRLEDWPKVSDSYIDDIYAGFEINWQYNGKSVGNVLITNISTNDAVGWGLIVTATIMDDSRVLPSENPTYAVLQIRFHYRFTHLMARDQIAVIDVRLFGHGKYTIDHRWEQTGIF